MPIDLLSLGKAILDAVAGPEVAEDLPVRDARILRALSGVVLNDYWLPLSRTYEAVHHILERTNEIASPEQREQLTEALVSRAVACFAADFNANIFLGNNSREGHKVFNVVKELGMHCVRIVIDSYSDRATWRETSLSERLHVAIRDFCGEWYEKLSPMFTEPAHADAFMALMINIATRQHVERSPQELQLASMMEPLFMQLYVKMKTHYANLRQ